MTNFDFLKNFNNELYEIGARLEEDVINSPRAVTADATLFLENLVKDIYRLSNRRLDANLVSFYKKIDNLYRMGVITYIYKNKLQDAYNLRNRIHKEVLDSAQEKDLAFELHKRLYYISKKYFRDYCENERIVDIPDYKKPAPIAVNFDNCIICGNSNKKSISNMCKTCNQKIENANIMLTLKNSFKQSTFTRQDLIEFGISESKAILLLMDLSKYDAVSNKGNFYTLNPENFDSYLKEIGRYIEIGSLITRFYKDEIPAYEIKQTEEYEKGRKNQKPYREFYKLVNQKIEETFERNLVKFHNVKKSMVESSMDDSIMEHWFYHEKESFNEGIINEAFILYNELMIRDFFRLKKKGHYDEVILRQLNISKDVFIFWQTQFMGGNFFKKSRNIKKNQIIDELKNNKSLDDALYSVGIGRKDFDKIYSYSKEENDDFYKNFDKEYTQKRQKLLIKHLKNNTLNRAIKLSKINKKQFMKWYYQGEKTFSEFYVTVTRLLMNQYLTFRKNDMDKKDILKKINVSREMYNSWSRHSEFEMFRDFEDKNRQITTTLIKRGLVINGIKEGKGKEEAIFSANLTPKDFVEIYNNSKKEHTDFHMRFDREYEKSRKKHFSKLIKEEDFYYTIQQCEISQSEFNKWYAKDQDIFLATNNPTPFYLSATYELMDKYLKARLNGKNQPDAAKSVGLSNTIINKWLNHPEYDMYYDFKKKNKQVTIDLIVDGFSRGKSKLEVSESCDIPLKTIEEFIELGKNGFLKYESLFNLYEEKVIPLHLEAFLNNLKNKTYYKSLKQAKISREEVEYYYRLGKDDDSKFADFSRDYLNLKISLYVDNILSKKSPKIAMKNSSLTKEEFRDNEKRIEDLVLKGRMILIRSNLDRNRVNGMKLSKAAGIGIDELYDWYFKGTEGDERFWDFAIVFELEVIMPRVVAFRKALEIGISRKFLLKKFKKEMGSPDFKIWERHDIFNRKLKFYDMKKDVIDERKILRQLKKSDVFDIYVKSSDARPRESFKKIFDDQVLPHIKISFIEKNNVDGKAAAN